MRQSKVYFVASGGRIKVGYSTDVQKRVAAISTYLAAPAELIGTIAGGLKLERAVHQHMKPFHIKGEWFRDCDEARRSVRNFLLADEKMATEFREPIKAGKRPAKYVPHVRTDAEYIAMMQRLFALLWPHDKVAGLMSITDLTADECRPWAHGETVPPKMVRAAIALRVVEYCFEDRAYP